MADNIRPQLYCAVKENNSKHIISSITRCHRVRRQAPGNNATDTEETKQKLQQKNVKETAALPLYYETNKYKSTKTEDKTG